MLLNLNDFFQHTQISKRQPLHFMLSVMTVILLSLYRGGILLTFTGDNLDVAQNPRLVLHLSLQSSCVAVDATTLTCLVPPTNANSGQIQYSLILDNAPFPDISDIELLQLSSSPNPSGFTLVVTPVSLEAGSAIVRITVRNMHLMLFQMYIHNYIGTPSTHIIMI